MRPAFSCCSARLILRLDAQAPVVALVGGTIITPGPTASRSVGTILIEGGRITQVGPEAKVKVPGGAQAIDARGKLRAIIEQAHKEGLKAYVHAPLLGFAKDALRAGADGFVHGILSDPVDTADVR